MHCNYVLAVNKRKSCLFIIFTKLINLFFFSFLVVGCYWLQKVTLTCFTLLFFSVKLDGRTDGAVDSREKLLEFCFDYCYWSVDPADPHYASQEEVMT